MQKLGFSEFEETFKDLLDVYVTTNYSHIEQNSDFYEDVIFKLFDIKRIFSWTSVLRGIIIAN